MIFGNEQRRIVAYLDSVQARLASSKILCSSGLPAHAFGRLQSQTQDELSPSLRFGDCRCFARRSRDALLPSVLDRAFKGEL